MKAQSGSKLKGDVFRLQDNEKLKWFKQLAARGNIRNIDDAGKASQMELYTDADPLWIIKHQEKAFPGSPRIIFFIPPLDKVTNTKYKIMLYLASNKAGICSYQDLANAIGYKTTNQLKRTFDRPEISFAIIYLGWKFVNKSTVPDFKGSGIKRLVNWSLYRKST